jgi:hypothetical protein
MSIRGFWCVGPIHHDIRVVWGAVCASDLVSVEVRGWGNELSDIKGDDCASS